MATAQLDPLPQLETSEDCRLSEERDQALMIRAKRRREEAAADRSCFDLTREKIIFGFEVTLTAASLMAFLVLLVVNPALLPLGLSGSSGCGSLLLLLRRPAS